MSTSFDVLKNKIYHLNQNKIHTENDLVKFNRNRRTVEFPGCSKIFLFNNHNFTELTRGLRVDITILQNPSSKMIGTGIILTSLSTINDLKVICV